MDSASKLALAERVATALGALFVDTAVPVIALWQDGRFASANRATIHQYGYSLEELLEMRIHDLIADERSIDADLVRAGREEHTSFSRRPHRRKDGSVLWVVPTAGPQCIDGENFVVSVLTDVTPILLAEERARNVAEVSLRDRQLVLSAIEDMLSERDVTPALSALARAFARALGDQASVWLPETEGSDRLKMVACHGMSEDEARTAGAARLDWGR